MTLALLDRQESSGLGYKGVDGQEQLDENTLAGGAGRAGECWIGIRYCSQGKQCLFLYRKQDDAGHYSVLLQELVGIEKKLTKYYRDTSKR